MVACANKKQDLDKADAGGKLESLTEMIGASNYLTKLGNAPTMKGASLSPDSKISGSIKPDMNVSSVDWDTLASRIKDGASYLGYQDGDLLRASVKGESFASIVTESPFAKKLNYENRARLDEGLADSKMVAQRVVESHRDKTGSEPLAAAPAPATAASGTDNEIRIASNQAGSPAESGERNASGGAVAPATQAGQAQAQAGNGEKAAANKGAEAAANRAMLEAERLEAVAQAAALARAEKRTYRSPASVVQSKVEDLLDTSLFQRISQTYRRKSNNMRTFDSRSGDLIRSIEKPEIFRSL